MLLRNINVDTIFGTNPHIVRHVFLVSHLLRLVVWRIDMPPEPMSLQEYCLQYVSVRLELFFYSTKNTENMSNMSRYGSSLQFLMMFHFLLFNNNVLLFRQIHITQPKSSIYKTKPVLRNMTLYREAIGKRSKSWALNEVMPIINIHISTEILIL